MQVDSSGSLLKQNTDFIRSYLMLKQLNREIPHKTTSDTTLYYTLLNSLHMVKRSINQHEDVSIPIIRDSFKVISQLSLVMSKTFPLHEIQEIVELVINQSLERKTVKARYIFFSSFLSLLFNFSLRFKFRSNNTYSFFQRKQRRKLILSLQELLNSQLIQTILESLLTAIESFSLHLRTVSQSETTLNTLMYENIYFVFEMLQLVLKAYQDQSAESSQSHNVAGCAVFPMPEALQEVSERLDKCVLYISDSFPLFVCKIWLLRDNLLSCYK